MPTSRSIKAAFVVLCGSAAALGAVAEEATPRALLDRMANAVQTVNYQGTVIRMNDGEAEALKVVHLVEEGVIRERVVAQDGAGLEIVRVGNEVHCILPDRKSVLVEQWNDQSTLFSTLPSGDLDPGSEYDVRIVRKERIAGREAIRIAIKPHDEFRYEHRLWLDEETGFPLQTQLIDSGGEALEQIKFADIELQREIAAYDLEPTYSTENFTWYDSPGRDVTAVVTTDWHSTDLPRGFRIVQAQQEALPNSDEVVTHILVSDGLAEVSVFVERQAVAGRSVERSRVGASNAFSTTIGEHRVTAVGDVPAVTVERIARSMELR
jgi:sigma-E factor negative regulatory protein RseB